MGYHGGPEELLRNLNKDLIELGNQTRVVTERSFLSLYLKTRSNMYWADVVIVISFPSTLTLYPFCRKPSVWICNEVPETFYRWYKVPLFMLNKHVWKDRNIICSNRYDADEVSKDYGVDYVIPFGVDWNFYSEGIHREDGTFRILQVGYIGRYKDQLDTLDIFNTITSKIPNSRLTLVGPKVPAGTGPQYWEKVENRIKDYDLQDKVVMTGQLPREKVREYYYNSDVFIHPVTGTGGWLAPFEALSACLPIITSTKFYGREYLDRYGIITDNYVGALYDIYTDREKYVQMAKEGSKWVKDNLTTKIYAQKILEVIMGVKDGKTG